MTADGLEPDLQYGDSGEAVLALQHRLLALGLLSEPLAGHFDESTAAALTALASAQGAVIDPHWVDSQVWDALRAAEVAGGLVPAAADAWRWDGESWQPAAAATSSLPGSTLPAGETAPVDATGQWVWDGTTWQPVT